MFEFIVLLIWEIHGRVQAVYFKFSHNLSLFLQRLLRLKSTWLCTCPCISLDTSICTNSTQTGKLPCLQVTGSKQDHVLVCVSLSILLFCSILTPICSNLTSFVPTAHILAWTHKRGTLGAKSTLNMPKDKLSAMISNWKNKYKQALIRNQQASIHNLDG